VEGTTVYDPRGTNIGSIKRLMIEKISDRLAYAVMSFGGFLGMGSEEHSIPWTKLTYDTSLGGYRTDVTEAQLKGAPPSLEIRVGTGAIATVNANFTIITKLRITGAEDLMCGRDKGIRPACYGGLKLCTGHGLSAQMRIAVGSL